MKKSIVRLTLAGLLLLNIAGMAMAQKPKGDKDTVNADKAAKPVFYQAAEEETSKGCCGPAVYAIGGLVVVAGVVIYLRKKKK